MTSGLDSTVHRTTSQPGGCEIVTQERQRGGYMTTCIKQMQRSCWCFANPAKKLNFAYSLPQSSKITTWASLGQPRDPAKDSNYESLLLGVW